MNPVLENLLVILLSVLIILWVFDLSKYMVGKWNNKNNRREK